MAIALFRVDERLIHGQVVVGWGERLKMDRIVVVDDELSNSPWEQELYCLGVPPPVVADFIGVDDARRSLDAWQRGAEHIVLLVRDVATLARLTEEGLPEGVEVNLGGIHHAPGRERVLPYLYLNEVEKAQLRALSQTGVPICARDLPGSRPVPVASLFAAS